MWIPIILLGGGVLFYFLATAKPAAPAPKAPVPGIPGLPGILPAGLFASSAPARPAAAAPAAAAPAAPAGPASNGPYFQAYWANINNAADDLNAGKITQDNFYAMETGYYQNAQGDFASGNLSAADMQAIQTAMQHWGVI